MEKSSARWWDPPSAALFVFSILISAWRLTVTDWVDNLGAVANLSLLGALIGLALGASRFEKRGVRWLTLGYSLTLVPHQLMAAYYGREIYLGERLVSLGGRLLFSLSEFASDRPVEDPVFFLALVAILYWGIALYSGYQLSRHDNTLAAILPAGLALLIIHHFDRINPGRLWLIAMYFCAALTLIGRGKYLRDRAAWERRGVHLAPETGPDLTTGAFIGAAVLILIAWNLPLDLTHAAAWQKMWTDVTRPWRATRDRLSRAFEALESPSPAARAEYFGGTLALGTQAAQGSDLVMIASLPPEALDLPRIYWRARVYDQYADGEWRESQSIKSKFTPEVREFPIPDRGPRLAYEFTLRSYAQGQSILPISAQPLWVSRPVDVTLVNLGNGEDDILAIETFPFLEPGEAYRVRSAMANPSIEELMAAGAGYPEWVTARYLQLPEDFSDRIRAFASQTTLGLETPYEKVQAITTVLRAQIEYRPSIEPAPQGADPLEWVLFDLKQGFCNYYATAEVLMLRSVGIPARMAVGYAQGDIVEGAQRPGELEGGVQEYSVTRKHTHAWPEVYFPGIGWVEFEPTANQDPIIRPETHNVTLPPSATNTIRKPTARLEEDTDSTASSSSASRIDWKRWLVFILWIAAPALTVLAWILANRKYTLTTRAAELVLAAAERRGERFPAWVRNAALFQLASPFERAFHPVNQSLRWLGEPPSVHLTPAERADALEVLLPEAEADIQILLREYQSAQYSRKNGDLPAARRASRSLLWQGLRAALRRARG